jgi:hypothetical protein
MRGSEWDWLDGMPPPITKLARNSSMHYQNAQFQSVDENDTVSTGAHTSEAATVSKGDGKTLVRMPYARFEQIIKALECLAEEGMITALSPVPPRPSGQGVDRNGRQCWSFIDEEARLRGLRPRAGWRVIERGLHGTHGAIYRAALIVRLEIGGSCHYWIEIECRKTERHASALMSGLPANPHEILEAPSISLQTTEENILRPSRAARFARMASACTRTVTVSRTMPFATGPCEIF